MRVLAKVLSIKIQQCKVPMFFLYFLLKQHVSKNLILELWTKNLKTNHKARFFKPQYLTKNLRYEVEFLDMIRSKKALNISWLLQVGVIRHNWPFPKRQQIVSQLYLKNELSYEVSFLHVARNQLGFLHVGRPQQKQTIMLRISKILVGY